MPGPRFERIASTSCNRLWFIRSRNQSTVRFAQTADKHGGLGLCCQIHVGLCLRSTSDFFTLYILSSTRNQRQVDSLLVFEQEHFSKRFWSFFLTFLLLKHSRSYLRCSWNKRDCSLRSPQNSWIRAIDDNQMNLLCFPTPRFGNKISNQPSIHLSIYHSRRLLSSGLQSIEIALNDQIFILINCKALNIQRSSGLRRHDNHSFVYKLYFNFNYWIFCPRLE